MWCVVCVKVLTATQLPVQEGRCGQRADPLLAEDGEARRVCHHPVLPGCPKSSENSKSLANSKSLTNSKSPNTQNHQQLKMADNSKLQITQNHQQLKMTDNSKLQITITNN